MGKVFKIKKMGSNKPLFVLLSRPKGLFFAVKSQRTRTAFKTMWHGLKRMGTKIETTGHNDFSLREK